MNLIEGYCQCGCGAKTRIPSGSNVSKGWVKGVPLKYLFGHAHRPARDPIERFWAKVDKSAECWVWTGAKRDGYGAFPLSHRKTVAAHRWLYETIRGAVEEGLQLDHLCRNRACVNPAHLEPVTCRENLMRGDTLNAANVAKTHCPRGHPYNGDNLILYRGRRVCRECGRTASRERQRRLRAKAKEGKR